MEFVLNLSFHGLKTGEQDSQVSGIYVESVVMGHGSCCVDGHSLGKW